MLSKDESSSGAASALETAVAVPGAAADIVVTDTPAPSTTIEGASTSATATATATTTGKKKFLGLGSYLPKVPSYLMQKNGSAAAPSSTTTATEDPADELKELPDFPDRRSTDSDSAQQQQQQQQQQTQPQSAAAAAAAALRRRGMSIEQNVSTLYRKMTIRQSSANGSSAATDSVSSSTTSQHNSLTGTGSNPNNVPSPRSDPRLKARRGACVATKFGTGIVVDVRLDDGFYIVELVPKSVAYLRDDMIVREIKAVVGERVKTRWGLATVEQYVVADDTYSIALDWRWDDDHVWRMKATTKKFDKILAKGSLMQNTKNMLFESYSTLKGSTSTGYAHVVARLNTAAPKRQDAQPLGKALTPFGLCNVLEVRADQFFVVETPCGATGFFHADAVKLLQRRTHFGVGDRVVTPYGLGDVRLYRDEDETYEVTLELPHAANSLAPVLFITDALAESQLAFAPTGSTSTGTGSSTSTSNATRLSSILTLTRNSVFSAGATVYSAGATVKASATGGLTTLSTVKNKVSTMAAVKLTKPKFQKGERVVTKMGSGFVVDMRAADRIYEVYLRRLKFTGYFHEAALTAFPYERVTHFVVDGRTIPAPEIPRNVSDVKRRQVINAAIQSAREGKFLDVPGAASASASAPVPAPAPVAMAVSAAPGVL